jgi:predicted O-linked N-acetylglucosamine transferase (SPINDLY family)
MLWLAALAAVPAAVLWLLVPLPVARANLRAEAERAGIDAARLVFADWAAADEHIARLRAADLALDVLPCCSHTTGSDALWAGVPLLSCLGTTFAGRVGASLLRAVGLDDLVLASPEAYGAKLCELAADRAALHALHRHLETERMQLPLFDTAGFTRDWERLLERAYDRAVPADR